MVERKVLVERMLLGMLLLLIQKSIDRYSLQTVVVVGGGGGEGGGGGISIE
jgi:hypothetical protein